MKAAIFSNHSPRVGFGVDRKMDVSRSQVMVVAASRNHLCRRPLQVLTDGFAPSFRLFPTPISEPESRRPSILVYHAIWTTDLPLSFSSI